MLIAVQEKNSIVSFIIIFGTLSFPIDFVCRERRCAEALIRSLRGACSCLETTQSDYVELRDVKTWLIDGSGGVQRHRRLCSTPPAAHLQHHHRAGVVLRLVADSRPCQTPTQRDRRSPQIY